jgi:hypothetical protein
LDADRGDWLKKLRRTLRFLLPTPGELSCLGGEYKPPQKKERSGLVCVAVGIRYADGDALAAPLCLFCFSIFGIS